MFDYIMINDVKHQVHRSYIAFSMVRMIVSKEGTMDRFEISVPKQWFYSNDKEIVFDDVTIEKVLNR
ncbi:hypothetical protein PBI_SCTP2_35 [Salicola phage SCTP-2]|nr:hypothetical protein PBI_SCTP2_35 [Salicola phage SCTP-2]